MPDLLPYFIHAGVGLLTAAAYGYVVARLFSGAAQPREVLALGILSAITALAAAALPVAWMAITMTVTWAVIAIAVFYAYWRFRSPDTRGRD
jgi:multisubunit Na+/H+ antiporter MnhE subunit